MRDKLGQGSGISAIAEATSRSRQAVYRIRADPAGAEATLATWDNHVDREQPRIDVFLS